MSCTSDKNIIRELILTKDNNEKIIIQLDKKITELLKHNENLITILEKLKMANRITHNRNLELGTENGKLNEKNEENWHKIFDLEKLNKELQTKLKIESETTTEEEDTIDISFNPELYNFLQLYGKENTLYLDNTIIKEYLRYIKIKKNLI